MTTDANYSDGVVTIRRLQTSDVDADLAAKDDEQIRWLWTPDDRERWCVMSPEEQRDHALATLQLAHDSFGNGPKWAFAVDTTDISYVAYVDCDLANKLVPLGKANIAYAAHPLYRGRGYVSRSVRLVLAFLRDNTKADEAHIIVDQENIGSLRVALAVGARPVETFKNEEGRMMVRHVLHLGSAQC